MARPIQFADMLEKGLSPNGGGMLDESAWFVSVSQVLRSEDSKVMEEISK